MEQYMEACKKFIPQKTLRPNGKNNLPGITPEEARQIKKKHRAWTRFNETKDQAKLTEFRRLRNKVKNITRKAVKRHEKVITEKIKENPKIFWNHVKSKNKRRDRIPELYKDNDHKQTTSSDQEKAEALSKQFVSVFTIEPENDVIPEPNPQIFDMELDSITISEEDVTKQLKQLNPNKSMGPDGLHPRVLREASGALSKPLTYIFNKSLEISTLPTEWKNATVTAIFKKGDRQDPGNYRPISLTSIPCKMLEQLIRKEIIEHMNRNRLFTDCQFGFRAKKSTTLQLLYAVEEWIETIDNGGTVDACYLDLQKAFDSVPHRRLIKKIHSYGISGKLLQWIQEFLTGRTQTIAVNGVTAPAEPVKSGVPQGSVLGPVLFILYINDMPLNTRSQMLLYADDAKLYNQISSEDDKKQLQEDINSLHHWSRKWLLNFHPQKCKVMRLGSRTTPTFCYTMPTYDATEDLQWTKCEKDLGVMIDDSLNFNQEIQTRAKKANTIVGIIRRSFLHLTEENFKILYKSLVRPHLEYAAPVWLPAKKKDIEEIENVQRRATKLVPTLRDLSYPERLTKLKLPSQRYRHLRGDMIEVYKILTGLYDIDPNHFFTPSNAQDTRGHSRKLQKPAAHTTRKTNSFKHRTITSWNSLPEDVVSAPSLNAFKNRLDRHWSRHPLLYDHTA
jgi:hypothetical protein